MQHHESVSEGASAFSASAREEHAENADASTAGAPSSNTAPANSMGRILRSGLDSLYLSVKGQLSEQSDALLSDLKTRAQSPDETVQATARIDLLDHSLCVLDRGRRKFAYVIEDNWFSISLASRNARALPLAYAQVSSEALTGQGAEACESQFLRLAVMLGSIVGVPSISRADLYADFCLDSDLDLSRIDPQAWISRPRKRGRYDEGERFTGLTFGLGGKLSARLYDKTYELRRSAKHYLLDLWAANGWDGLRPVWRLEFQCAREVLPDSLTQSLGAFLPALPAIWQYLIRDWLRLTLPNPEDDTRTRWPTHPLWDLMALAQPDAKGSGLRVRKTRVPSDETLFKNGLWAISSLMAREGITELDEALGEFMHRANRFHTTQGDSGSESMAAYLLRKARAKARRYNTAPRLGSGNE